MRVRAILVLLFTFGGLAEAQAQQPRVRMVHATPMADSVAFGVPFDLEVVLEVAPGAAVLLPDTLDATASMASIGHGQWTGEVSGDTAHIRLVYPVIGYRDGMEQLPQMTLGVISSAGVSERWIPLRTVSSGMQSDLSMVTLPLGSTTVRQHPQFSDELESMEFVPRPPADVAGGEWSLWLMLAAGLATVAGVGGIGGMVPRWWSQSGAGVFARMRRRDARGIALSELDRLRASGLLRDGHVQQFYVEVTDTLRGYLAGTHAELNRTRTMTELTAGMRRASLVTGEALPSALHMAERVKFGLARPDAEAAARDWTAVRDWINRQGPA